MSTKQNKGLAFYVAQDGDDAWSGKLPEATPDRRDGPFATLEKARNTIRTVKPLPEGGATVYLRGGTYPLARSFALTAQDSGTEDAPICYRAWEDETVRLIGGRILSGFEPVQDTEVLERLILHFWSGI